jgi:hypothetical protein
MVTGFVQNGGKAQFYTSCQMHGSRAPVKRHLQLEPAGIH